MPIQRNLNELIPEPVRRTLVDFDRRMGKVESLLRTIKPSNGGGNGGLSPQQFELLKASLIGAFGQPLVGDNSAPDPLVTPIGTGSGTVTNFSAGNLSPLFTTNETTTTTTPVLGFAQINQNANLVFAGPASGAAAAPTFRALTAADFYASTPTLLGPPTTFDLNVGTKQTLATVPAGKSALPVLIIAYAPSVDLSGGATNNLQLGFNAGSNDWTTGANLGITDLIAATDFKVFGQEQAASNAVTTLGTAGQLFGAKCDVAFGSAATLQIATFGLLF